jgi:hypothetical protein
MVSAENIEILMYEIYDKFHIEFKIIDYDLKKVDNLY